MPLNPASTPKLGDSEGCPLPRRLGGLGRFVGSPRGCGAEPRPETHFEGHRTLLYAPIFAKSHDNKDVLKLFKLSKYTMSHTHTQDRTQSIP